MEFSSLIGWCKLDEFILFFSSLAQKRKKKMETPTHIAAHLQAPTSRRSNQRLAKELQFCRHTQSIVETKTVFLKIK
jgi:hypothetical protein